jgi:hypothetical protein
VSLKAEPDLLEWSTPKLVEMPMTPALLALYQTEMSRALSDRRAA